MGEVGLVWSVDHGQLWNQRWNTTWTTSLHTLLTRERNLAGGTAAAAPPPFRPGKPAVCGSHPIVTPYYCRLGDLLCFVFIVSLLYFFC